MAWLGFPRQGKVHYRNFAISDCGGVSRGCVRLGVAGYGEAQRGRVVKHGVQFAKSVNWPIRTFCQFTASLA